MFEFILLPMEEELCTSREGCIDDDDGIKGVGVIIDVGDNNDEDVNMFFDDDSNAANCFRFWFSDSGC